ncbi:MAG TPA: SCO family protein [Vicinamibacterales bacterium]|nr:SCO family protein [Vicinamibacterales bacterium]
MTHHLTAAAVTLSLLAAPAFAQYDGVPRPGMMTQGNRPAGITPNELKKVEFSQRLGVQVPLDLPFVDETGAPVRLSQYFDGRPVILALVYYECPMLCVQALNGLVKSLKTLALEPGRDYNIVTVSFNPRETPAQAAEKKDHYLALLQRDGGRNGWHFLTGEETPIRLLTDSVGFHYVYDEATQQYAHPTGIVVLTPEGRTSKYIYGLDYGPRDLRLALVEAADRKIGSPVDALLLYCFHYDPEQGKYGLVLMNVMRLAGIVTVAMIGGFILIMRRREKRGRGVAR